MWYFEKRPERPRLHTIILTVALVCDLCVGILGLARIFEPAYFDVARYQTRAIAGAIIHPILTVMALFSIKNNQNVGLGCYMVLMFAFSLTSSAMMLGMVGTIFNPKDALFPTIQSIGMFFLSFSFLLRCYKFRIAGVNLDE